jgi:DNA-binding transcriptional ArsR family regulator
MLDSTLTGLETLFLALSDKTRLRLLALMVDGEVPVGLLAENLGESQPKISRHLASLRNSGLVSTRRDGKWIYYSIEGGLDSPIARVLDATLRSIVSPASGVSPALDRTGDEYVGAGEWSGSAHGDNDWAPAEMEIYLL